MSTNQKTDEFNGVIGDVPEWESMPVEDRRKEVLLFLDECGLALKPITIYRNLKLHRRITFGDETVKNYLHKLVEDGYVRRVDPKALESGELVDVERGEGRGAYIITDAGRDYLNS